MEKQLTTLTKKGKRQTKGDRRVFGEEKKNGRGG